MNYKCIVPKPAECFVLTNSKDSYPVQPLIIVSAKETLIKPYAVALLIKDKDANVKIKTAVALAEIVADEITRNVPAENRLFKDVPEGQLASINPDIKICKMVDKGWMNAFNVPEV